MEEFIVVVKLLEKFLFTLVDYFLFFIALVDIRDFMVVNVMMKFVCVFCMYGCVGVCLILLFFVCMFMVLYEL